MAQKIKSMPLREVSLIIIQALANLKEEVLSKEDENRVKYVYELVVALSKLSFPHRYGK